MFEGALLLLLVIPPLALLARGLVKFFVQWFRGWPVDSQSGDTSVAHTPAHDPSCPSCGQPLAAKARRCFHCGVQLADEPLLAPDRRRLVRF